MLSVNEKMLSTKYTLKEFRRAICYSLICRTHVQNKETLVWLFSRGLESLGMVQKRAECKSLGNVVERETDLTCDIYDPVKCSATEQKCLRGPETWAPIRFTLSIFSYILGTEINYHYPSAVVKRKNKKSKNSF